jgi:protease-4
VCAFLLAVCLDPLPAAADLFSSNARAPYSVTLPGGTTADPTPFLSRDVNPAAVAAVSAPELFILWGDEIQGGALATTLGSALHLAFGLDHVDRGDPLDFWRTSLDVGIGLPEVMGLGFTWQSIYDDGGSLDGLDPLSAGLFVRTGRWASVGFSARNLSEEDSGAGGALLQFATGIALRPGTDHVTLGVDVAYDREGNYVDPEAYLAFEPVDGIQVSVNGWTRDDTEDGWQWGAAGMVTLSTLHSDLYGGYGRTSASTGGWMAAARMSGDSRPSVLEPGGLVVHYVLPGGLSENRTGGVLSPPGASLLDIRLRMKQMAEDPDVAGVLIEIGPMASGWAQTQELAESIRYLKAKGKKVIAYVVAGGNREYYLAAQAHKVVVTPALALFLTGISGNLAFVKDFLGLLGVEVQFVKVGKYKSFPEQFTRTEPSPEYREAHEAVMDAFFGQLVDGIAAGRGVEREKVVQWIDAAPFTALRGRDAGLVDYVAPFEDMDDILKKEGLNPKRRVEGYPARDYRVTRWGAPERIAVLVIDGSIVDGRSMTVPMFGNRLVGSRTILDAISQILSDPSIEGVLLRVNSNGGSALASELMNRALTKLKEKRKLVVSMGDTAASGGYYVAAPGQQVLAMPGTVTGSIGIYFGKVVISGLLDKLGIQRTPFERGKHAGLMNLDHRLTQEELQTSTERIEEMYELFLRRVAETRNKTRDQVHEMAQGRVWPGARALELGLVDRTGGYLEALAELKTRVGLADTDPVELVFYPQLTFGEALQQALLGAAASPESVAADLEAVLDVLSAMTSTLVWAADPWAPGVSL